ncbi:hypothetical protein GMORB2_5380 [Geosmithia morbida]|uniref:DUF8035 domain-containing protein n=1 Tax=Geosmithia morbida TaxID=1094350 RepID=A0A9P5D7P4_9HYPO|nr:uncharacterized protein GMORB2_5380 [Geosmithia morbida]KAF4124714.1 hypothetical protein GMORB2_5380 [Geosmithia morbida]
MTDRHGIPYEYPAYTGGHHPPPPRSPPFTNPARSSMPSSIGYSSMYAGDMHVLPSSAVRYPSAAPPRASHATLPPSSSAAPSGGGGGGGAPVSTSTRTYTLGHDPRGHPSVAARDVSRSRRSTVDSAARPPPVIVTTTRPSHTSSSNRSPVRGTPRASDGHVYTQPAASSAAHPRGPAPSHGGHHHHHRHHTDDDDYVRSRDRERELERERERTDAAIAARDADAYRSARPSVIYTNDPRHSSSSSAGGGGGGVANNSGAPTGGGATTTINYGDDGYHYTNAGEMARYDLDHPGPRQNRHRRTESLDQGYYRPNVSYNTNQRSINVNTSDDVSRNYAMNTSRIYNGGARGGPPPSTRGFDRINRTFGAPVASGTPGPSASSPALRDVPPAAPVPPSPAMAAQTQRGERDAGPPPAEARRGRPVSLYQISAPRSSHHEDFHRSREDERVMRESRDRNIREPGESPTRFRDDNVTARGFGIRASPPEHELSPEQLREHRSEGGRERRGSRAGSDPESSRMRDKVARGVGVAAAAMGLSPNVAVVDGDESDRGKGSSSGRGKSSPKEDGPKPKASNGRPKTASKDRRPAESERDLDRDREAGGSSIRVESGKDRGAEKPGSLDTRGASGSDTERGTQGARRGNGKRPPGTFNPNDASDITMLREQLASMKTDGSREPERTAVATSAMPGGYESDASTTMATPSSRSASPPRSRRRRRYSDDQSEDDENSSSSSSSSWRGRDVALVKPERTVRVVSPPREKKDEKPLKGILKPPKPSFPEEDSYPREGVAPHKEDKKAKEVPPGARWTKIGRKFVNPEALTIGKERFEVRDDSVIVLRVLSKDEIQAYATATQKLRERRKGRDRDRDHDDDDREKDRARRSSRRKVKEYDDDYDHDDHDDYYDLEYERERRPAWN